MHPTKKLTAVIALGAAATWLAAHAQEGGWPISWIDAGPAKARYVLTEREAFLPFPPELVAAPRALWAHWSPDARHVLAAREEARLTALDGRPPEGETSLLLWNRRARKAMVLWKQPLLQGTVEVAAWLPGTSVALAVVHLLPPPMAGAPPQPEAVRRELLRIDAARGVARSIAVLGMEERLSVSPTHPIAALLRRDAREEPEVRPDGQTNIHIRRQSSLRIIRAGGAPGPAFRLPEDVSDLGWTPEGRPFFVDIDRQMPLPLPGKPAALRPHEVDPTTGTIRLIAGVPPFAVPTPSEQPVRLARTKVSLGKETPLESVQPLWLESAAPGASSRALLSGDSAGGVLAPDGSGVLYQAQGAAWVIPFLRLPKQAFLEARRAAFRAVALSNGKQIGLALVMYAQDYDEVFPPSDEKTVDRLLPYLKQAEIFNDPTTGARGFTYLLRDTSLKTIDNPSTTPIGYLSGPGGRVVIYVDGHVTWEDQ